MNADRPPSVESPGSRIVPREEGTVAPDIERRGGAASNSVAPLANASDGLPSVPPPLAIGPRTFAWGSRTFVMAIVNVTPDSFSGDGLLAAGKDPVAAAVALAGQARDEGADLVDVGGASSRPGHEPVGVTDELARVVPVIHALRAEFPDLPISVDTVQPGVAAAALEAGAHLVNDVWGVADDDRLARVAAEHGAPLVLMHNRAQARYTALMAEIVADLERAIERAVRAGVPWERLIVDPGFGFGKTPRHNLEILRSLSLLRSLGRPILLGTSRKSTLGKVLDLPPGERVEATLVTTALGIATGIDMVRVHDVRANARAARMADAVVRGWQAEA